jgi:predicted exporter
MNRRDLRTGIIGALLLGALTLYGTLTLKVSTDITHFLPDSDDRKLADISRRLTDSPATRTMILSVGGPDVATALTATRELADKLRAHGEVAAVRIGPEEHFAEAAYALLFPHRDQLYSDHPQTDWATRLSPEGLARAAAELKQQLTLPTAVLTKRLAPTDPLQSFPSELKRLQSASAGAVQIVDGQFVSSDGKRAILFLETKHSPFEGASQGPFVDFLDKTFRDVNTAHQGTLTLEQSGVNRFAVESERIIRDDINRISSFSTLAVVLIFLLLFRSIRVLVLSFVPIWFGFAAALAASMFFFGEIHGLTLAFGSTLIGVCVDFPVHFLNHHALEPDPNGPRGTMKRIQTALLLGGATTVAGFAGLAWTSFPGMRELAVFASVGITAALLSTAWLLPALSAHMPRTVPLHRRFSDAIGRTMVAMHNGRRSLYILSAVALLLCAIGLPRVHWDDSLGSLNTVDQGMKDEEEKVRAQVSRMDAGRFIIVTAPDDAQALALNDRIVAGMSDAKTAGQLDDFSSLHTLIFAPELQAANAQALHADPTLPDRVKAALEKEGFRPEAFQPFFDTLAKPAPAPLTLQEVLKSPLGDIVRPFRVDLGQEVGLVTLVRGVTDAAAVRARVEAIDGAHYFDQEEFLSRAYGNYRRRALQLVALGVLAMLLVLLAEYRNVRRAIAAGTPALLASTATLALLGLAGVTTNLLHLVALLLVLSTGEDYAVYLLATAKRSDHLIASGSSVVLCCFMTVLGFGLLGFSRMPALHALGMTTGIGILLCMVFAPLALLIAGEAAPDGSETATTAIDSPPGSGV